MYFQVSTFNNLPSYASNPEWVERVLKMVTTSLESERVEIRSKASQVLSGLLHCEILNSEQKEALLVS